MSGQELSWWRWLTGRKPWTGEDRRVWVRFPEKGNAEVRIAAPGGDAPIQAIVRDISRGGMALIVERGFDGGNLLLVELPPRADYPGATVLAYVLRAEPLPNGGWALGCAFATELADGDSADLSSWLPSDGDRRTWARLSTRGSCRFYPVGEYALTRRAHIVNVSPAGLALAAVERVEPGAVLAMELAVPDGKPISVIASVVSASPLEEGRWLLGCSFDREMDEDELRPLLEALAPIAD
jgi:hypothetical protein